MSLCSIRPNHTKLKSLHRTEIIAKVLSFSGNKASPFLYKATSLDWHQDCGISTCPPNISVEISVIETTSPSCFDFSISAWMPSSPHAFPSLRPAGFLLNPAWTPFLTFLRAGVWGDACVQRLIECSKDLSNFIWFIYLLSVCALDECNPLVLCRCENDLARQGHATLGCFKQRIQLCCLSSCTLQLQLLPYFLGQLSSLFFILRLAPRLHHLG